MKLIKIIGIIGLCAAGGAATHTLFFRAQNRIFSARIVSTVIRGEEKTSSGTESSAAVSPRSVRVPILVYHSTRPPYPEQTRPQKEFNVPPDVFELQLRHLKKKGYIAISFDALSDALTQGTALPEHPIILTFDDAWQNQYAYAFPLLKKYGLTGTFFVFTNAIGRKNYLSWDELKELDREGMAIGDHTKSHPYLFKIEDEEKLREEIIGSKKILEARLGHEVTAFATPFGTTNDRIIEAVKEAGYKAARTLRGGKEQTADDLFKLKAFQAPNTLPAFAKSLRDY